MLRKQRAALVFAFAAGVVISVALAVILCGRSEKLVVPPHQERFVEQAQRLAGAAFQESPEVIARLTFPLVFELSDRTCVELRPVQKRGVSYTACFQTSTGRLLEDRATSASFGH
jgi:hypothetical protein